MISLTIVSLALIRISPPKEDAFTGLCVYSSPGFSTLYNGNQSVAIGRSLEVGRVYTAYGRLRKTSRGLWMDVSSLQVSPPNFPLESIEGAYWTDRSPQLLTPERVYLASPINASKGELVLVKGLEYGKNFYPIEVHTRGLPASPKNGFPFVVEGVVLSTGRYISIWNGSEEFKVLKLRGVEVSPGQRVRVVGIVRVRDYIYLYPSESEDITLLGYSESKPLWNSSIGDIVETECLVLNSGSTLKLNCTDLRLYGFKARTGDLLHIRALRRKSSLLCLNCSIVQPREKLPNELCGYSPGNFAKISGTVTWVKRYRNGFGLANVTYGNCWVLLKLPTSLGVSVTSGENVTAYGFFTTYREKPAFEVRSGDDICSGSSC
ncbi:hypothetical protein [Thermococcus peptonophilus]|uniref:hypothetical protein n=1 Tax=Thermococcus peptonophilus TaxID=53952 RepID=UPI001E3727DD|nr:hypothetical protein [Thermococcus peptonophilus]